MLTTLQQFIQNRILLSIYPGCSIEEAEKKDFEIFRKHMLEYLELADIYLKQNDFIIQMIKLSEVLHSPTLPRVLHCLGNREYCFFGRYIAEIDEGDNDIGSTWGLGDYICDRKLLNEDGTDATLRDQSEETQKAIALLLGWKDE